jgi:hypothetical protein
MPSLINDLGFLTQVEVSLTLYPNLQLVLMRFLTYLNHLKVCLFSKIPHSIFITINLSIVLAYPNKT